MTENESVADEDEETGADVDGAPEGAAASNGSDAEGAPDPADTDVESAAAVGDGSDDESDQRADEGDGATARDEGLVERIEGTAPEELADEITELRDRVAELESALETAESEVDDLESRLKRKQADFQNYKKRMEKRREEEKQRATEDLVERLLDVRDNLQRALDTDEDADIRDGVETTLRQFDRVLDAEDVTRVDPEPGEEVDPKRHEVLMRVESGREPGTIDAVHRPGYEMADKLLRSAQVTVAEENGDGEDD